MTSPLWYCARNGHTYGPFDADALRSLVLQSRVHPTDAVSNGGAWFSAASIPGLFGPTTATPVAAPVAALPVATPAVAPVMQTPVAPALEAVAAAATPVAATPLVPPTALPLLAPRPVPTFAAAPAGSVPMGAMPVGVAMAGAMPLTAPQRFAGRGPLARSWRTTADTSSYRTKISPWILGGIALLLVMWLWGLWTMPLAPVSA